MNCYQNSKKIKKVLLIGLGGVGTVYANLISKNKNIDLKILADNKRIEAYKKNPRTLNNKPCLFSYLQLGDTFNPDLIILSTKSTGLKTAVESIKSYVNKNTLILSFINGITSEEYLAQYFSEEQIIPSYIICHTIFRENNNINHDGITKIVWGDKFNNKNNINSLKQFFKETNLENVYSNYIQKDLLEKFCFNCCVNQISAITGYTFAQMQNDKSCLDEMKYISTEINAIANAMGIKDINLVQSTFAKLKEMIPDGKTSMLQDFENKRTPEIDLFGEVVIKLAKKYKIDVPYNLRLYSSLKEKYNTTF